MISIIAATHNHDQFLSGAIESVRRQTYSEWEHLVVDDGSTDDTPSVLKKCSASDSRLRVTRTENQGQPAALNHGISQARGEWIAFLDSDDEYLPDHLSVMLRTIGSRDFALGKFQIENCSGMDQPVVRDFYNPGKVIAVDEIEVVTGVLFGRRDAILKVGGFKSVRSADTDLFNRLKDAGLTWSKSSEATYRYFFGRLPQSMAIRERDSDT